MNMEKNSMKKDKKPLFSKAKDGVEGIYANLKKKTFVLHPTVLVLVTYILLLITKVIDVTLLNRENEYYSVVILQMMIFILPGAIWCKFSGERFVSKIRLRMVNVNSIPLILSAALLIASGSLLISFLLDGFNGISNNFSLYDTFVSNNKAGVTNTIYLIVAYALLPSICEEFVYRGILCHEYERGGVLRAVVVSSVFFALLHFNIKNLPVYLFSGVILAMTLYATRSVVGPMIAHFLYNIFGLFGQPYMSNLYRITNSPKLFIIIITTVCLLSAALFCEEASRLYSAYLYKAYPADYRKPVIKDSAMIRKSYLDVVRQPSAIACFAIYVVAVVISLIRG